MELNLAAKIEAMLFARAEPVATSKLADWLGVAEPEITSALEQLAAILAERGIRLVQKDDLVTLGTAPELSFLIEELRKEELSHDLGKAGLETLAIVLYRGPVSRSEIDYIRGVNSSFILRHLLVRGLVEREVSPHNARSFIYKPTFDLMSLLGVTNLADLPGFKEAEEKINEFLIVKDHANR